MKIACVVERPLHQVKMIEAKMLLVWGGKLSPQKEQQV